MAQWTAAVSAAQLARLLGPRLERSGRAAGGHPDSRRVPAYRGLADGVRLLVLEGRVPVSARLPAERELASALRVSRTTVAAAYDALRADGFVKSRRGAGSWTAIPDGRPVPAGGLEPLPPEAAASMIDFGAAALPAPEPWLTRAIEGALAELPAFAATHGDFPAGLPPLREAIADHYSARGIPTMPEQIMVTTGAMGAAAAACRLFAGRGERIAVEAPSYANVLQLFREHGARLVPVAMAEHLAGWDMAAWRRALRDAAPRMAYVIPDFHNPTGALPGDDQRRELVETARAAGVAVVADETMTELAIDPVGGMPRPLSYYDRGGGTVVSFGSASKAFWPGMRIGWLRAAPEVVRRMASVRAFLDLGSPVVEQLALVWLLRGQGWDQAVSLRRALARANRDALVAALRRHVPDWEFDVPRGGLTMWVRTGGLSGSRIAVAGEQFGVRVPAGTRFGVDGAFEGYVRLPFSAAAPVAEEAVARLAAAADAVRSGGPLDLHSGGSLVA
ncbi:MULTISPECIES: MocR-like transcription factor YczR [Streptomycetaceae]|nr:MULTISPECIES: PLP-dependent aminotransferase family protein [Streptomycetaceae]MYS62190.1 aminotransferase class I/II-fold pyridoxal phosphate-dependent enzyme [Streptomyces sp. SID5468]CCB78088.1 putative GntR-family transcriptional regulator [Streptantibioticus cattleyicolor NRRL 8057 = DSM 46488]